VRNNGQVEERGIGFGDWGRCELLKTTHILANSSLAMTKKRQNYLVNFGRHERIKDEGEKTWMYKIKKKKRKTI